MPDLLHFEWARDPKGYSLKHIAGVARARPTIVHDALDAAHDVIEGNGGRPQSYRPFAEGPALYKDFADLGSPPEIVAFASRFGLLTQRRGSERLAYWQDAIRGFRQSVRFAESGRATDFVMAWNKRSPVRLVIEFDPIVTDGRPTLRVVPRTLHDALWLQLAQSLASATGLRRCAECSNWFVFGTGTGRRKSADYCSDKCRKVAHRHRPRLYAAE